MYGQQETARLVTVMGDIMLFRFIESRLNAARRHREASEAYRAALVKQEALLKDPANWCAACDGEGETRVRGVRTETGRVSCCHCGGTGLRLEP